ncbi:hypothetical protein, partial [Bradyrhizobium sp. STM 3843]|uniref:hypothetical protein n=1 Tax=Bradyrhizobium sp. STM 3843 TaxID=551947 RepID=UPI001AEBE1B4
WENAMPQACDTVRLTGTEFDLLKHNLPYWPVCRMSCVGCRPMSGSAPGGLCAVIDGVQIAMER